MLQKIDYFGIWPYSACLKPVFSIKFGEIEKSQNYNRKIIWKSQQKGAFHTMSTSWSQWFQTYLVNTHVDVLELEEIVKKI